MDMIANLAPIIGDLTKGEVVISKEKAVLIKTRKKFKKESHFLVYPKKECKYIFKDIRSLKVKLTELKELQEKGLINKDDYEKKKQELLTDI